MAGPISYVTDSDSYQAGVCNIGPAEVARRRRAGYLGVVVAAVLAVDRRRSLEILGAAALGGLSVAARRW